MIHTSMVKTMAWTAIFLASRPLRAANTRSPFSANVLDWLADNTAIVPRHKKLQQMHVSQDSVRKSAPASREEELKSESGKKIKKKKINSWQLPLGEIGRAKLGAFSSACCVGEKFTKLGTYLYDQLT